MHAKLHGGKCKLASIIPVLCIWLHKIISNINPQNAYHLVQAISRKQIHTSQLYKTNYKSCHLGQYSLGKDMVP